ncbi:2-oxoglutarate dehydrogenase, E2 component, dihydrolipoamide succinyltransferase, partial [Couchioplanes caeruleus]
AETAPARPAAPAAEAVSGNGAGDAGYVTPLVRKLAAEKGVDLASITGTGVGGRIRKQDVIEAADAAAKAASPAPAASAAPAAPAATPAPSPLRGRTEKLTRIRATIARRMVESLQVSAQLTTVVEVDVTKIAQLRGRAKADFQAKHGVKLTFLPFFALAAVEALRQHPVVNSSIDQEAGTVTYHDGEHLGIAVDTPKGLVVPVLRDAGDLSLAGLAKRIADVAERTRNNKISPDELSGGTFTLTNTGSRGALFDTPIINQPQVGILGTGAVVKRAVVVDDPNLGELIVPRSMIYLALSYDHRIVDGADAARFLVTIKERLEAGQFEGDLGLHG